MSESNWKLDLIKILKGKAARMAALALIGLFTLRLGVNWVMSMRGSVRASTVKVSTLSFLTIDKTLTLPGNVEAIQQATLYAHVSGYLKKILVDEGDTVKENQLLAIVDAPDVIQEYRNAKAEYDFKETTRSRYEELLKENVVSRQEYDKIDAETNQAKARFDNASANQGYTFVRAPFSGSIARRLQYPGDFISAPAKGGSPSPLFVLVNESKLRIAVNIPQKEIGNVSLGHEVDIKVDTFQNKVFSGKVSRIDALLDESTKTQRALVDIENSTDSLHAGMFASAVLHAIRKNNVPMIQKDAIIVEGVKNYIYVVSDGKTKKLEVEIGDTQKDLVEIRQPVIDPKSQIVVSGGQSLVDGQSVEVSEVIPSISDNIQPKPAMSVMTSVPEKK